ncbi:MAG: dienelactone hydrolase family protein [Coleofasciculaceae cyanobacterium SM2_1_6]|nr:dienelactone hydrolase family protein [Coleofasciculaceae cyanobacterium SM2_1_6]
MATPPITTQFVQVPHGDLKISAYLARPETSTALPAVIVIQEIFGVNFHIRDVTERFAKAGYVAIAPALYQRTAPGFETGYTPEDVTIGRSYAQQTTAAELLGDLQATIDYLKAENLVQDGAIGCIGFCFGGHVAYLAATLPEIRATASFYGAGIALRTPGGGAPTVTRTPEITGTIYTFFGTEDASIPPDQIATIQTALEQHQIKHKVLVYEGADHGFCCDARGSYNPTAATAAFQEVQELFQRELGA